jgi:tetratricopeptide (TPR) repeat protein
MRGLCRFATIIAVGCGIADGAGADAVSDLDDAAARMQYAFFTADVRGVEEALGLVQKVDLPAALHGMKEYFTAYGQWKLAELHTDEALAGRRAARGLATKSASACARAAEEAQRIDARFAEAFAIQAICSDLASRAPNVLSTGNCSKHKGLRTALELAPANPRVKLIEAQCADDVDRSGGTTRLESLKLVVQAFEAAPPSRPGRPDWGQPEALLMLGQAYLQRGDPVAARDFIERALVITPDYRKARDALEKAAARPR